jgi:hypothetical protein
LRGAARDAVAVASAIAVGIARRGGLLLQLQDGRVAVGQALGIRRRGPGGGGERQQHAEGQQRPRRS